MIEAEHLTSQSGGCGQGLSLFYNDAFHRCQIRLRLASEDSCRPGFRALFFVTTTWVILAVLSWLAVGGTTGKSFFLETMAYAQFLVGIPLFVVAEMVLDQRIRAGAQQFINERMVPEDSRGRFATAVRQVNRLAAYLPVDAFLLVVAYASTWSWVIGDLTRGTVAWYTVAGSGSQVHLSAAGWWAALYAVPLFNFWVGRWCFKAIFWCVFLWKVSRIRLSFSPTHPDRTGGLGFLSQIQATFGILVFAFGCIVVANTVSRTQHGVTIESFTTWAPIGVFVLVAPAAFLIPLLFFSRQIATQKQEAVFAISAKVSSLGRALFDCVQSEHGAAKTEPRTSPSRKQFDLAVALFERARAMRVVPFDFKSAAQLFASAVTPVIPLAVNFLPLPDWGRALLSGLG